MLGYLNYIAQQAITRSGNMVSARKASNMEKKVRRLVACVVLILLSSPVVGEARGGERGESTWSPAAAAKYLDDRAEFWLQWSSAARGQGTACIACHTTLPFALARPALAERLGEDGVRSPEQKLIDNVKKRVESWDKIVAGPTSEKDPFVPFYSGKRKPSALGTESVLNALVLVNYESRRLKEGFSTSTKKVLANLWQQQQQDGAWLWLDFDLNPWENDSAYYGASLAAVALGTAGREEYDRAEAQPKLAALKKFLSTQYAGQPLHHRVLALWASSRLPGVLTDAEKAKLIAELFGVQEADGGWSLAKLGRRASGKGGWASHGVHPDGAISDGYATGLIVLALKRAGVAADNAQLKKAVAWLVSREKDGAWPALYPNRPRKPQENVGKFMRDASTGFAILALAEPNAPMKGPAPAVREALSPVVGQAPYFSRSWRYP
jgi:squalene-hopene/tetraprenyl-beta-curcumene cyclase